jgi:ribonucleoside-diphosphate reductase alpha chain
MNTPSHVITRDGKLKPFDASKIKGAIAAAFLKNESGAYYDPAHQVLSSSEAKLVGDITDTVIDKLMRRNSGAPHLLIEDIQDQVELLLFNHTDHRIARGYVLYRERRHQERLATLTNASPNQVTINVNDEGVSRPLDVAKLRALVRSAVSGYETVTDVEHIVSETLKNLYDGVPAEEVRKSAILSARQLIEKEPAYSRVTARLLMHSLRREVLGEEVTHEEMATRYAEYFPTFIKQGIEAELLDPELAQFDLARLGAAMKYERDYQFDYLGLQTLFDRYFLHIHGHRIELPQAFFMRVAMGLALREIDREARAIEFYNVLSTFDFMSSTPTLFNSGTLRSQLSSCYLTTIADDLDGIYEGLKENALLSKFAGGLGNDWTPVRALGSHIKGTNGKSQGIVPFLKVVNDTAVAVNQGGKRKGAVCAYLETWHADIEEFLELRKNTGDDRRRTHDMNTANWIPDLFMKRVMEGADWTLFSPSEVPDLHDLFGKAFEEAYTRYEAKAERGEMRVAKKIPALQLWRKMLTMLFETGHPWFTFKDPCNIRSPQQHVGVVHSSNLCTEITLNTNDSEIAVCNLGSVNLVNHMVKAADGSYSLDQDKVRRTTKTAMRMLDNVIDINFYPVKKARNSNLKHRPVGLGIMGFQDCLHLLRVPYASQEAVEFADTSMEVVAYHAYYASTEMAQERGRYPSYAGSLWSKGILPQDSNDLLLEARGGYLEVDRSSKLDWTELRSRIATYGMRNSNCLAIAPTATIANIVGVSASIEPNYQNIFVKSNLSGEFTVINEHLVHDLKERGLWDDVMIGDIKYFDGSLHRIDRVPADLKAIYATAFEVEAQWLVEAASRRQKWIDQAQSLNIYMAGASGKKMDDLYKLAWIRGLKTTYYLRTLSASSAEKSTGKGGELNAVPVAGGMSASAAVAAPVAAAPITVPQAAVPAMPEPEGAVCTMRPGDPGFEECESCQ